MVMRAPAPGMYEFVLHLESVRTFQPSIGFLLFQFLWLYMQTAVPASPIVRREIMEYRRTRLRYALAVRQFAQAVIEHDREGYYVHAAEVYGSMMRMWQHMRAMLTVFPFSPSVHFESSLHEADVMENFARASAEYRKASLMLGNPAYIFATTRDDSCAYPAPLPVTVDARDDRFLSCRDEVPNAARLSVYVQLRDPYIGCLTHTFTANSQRARRDRNSNRSAILFLSFVVVLSGLLFGVVASYTLLVGGEAEGERFRGEQAAELARRAVIFLQDVCKQRFNVQLLYTILNQTLNTTKNEQMVDFYGFVKLHVLQLDAKLLDFQDYFYLSEFRKEVAQPTIRC